MTIKHRSGKQLVGPDCLSRIDRSNNHKISSSLISTDPATSAEVPLRSGRVTRDVDYQEVRRILTAPPLHPSLYEKTILEEFHLKDQKPYTKEGRLLVSRDESSSIIKEYHEKALSHLDFKKTLEAIRERFMWPKMRQQIWDFVMSCKTCFQYNSPTVRRRSGIVNAIQTFEPRELLCVDFMGPLPTARFGDKYCLVAVDHYSKMGFAFPCRSTEGPGVRNALKKMFQEHGVWKRVHADKGSAFISNETTQFLKEQGIEVSWASTGHHQSNGACERLIRTISGLLRKTTSNAPAAWPMALPRVLTSYNNAYHSATKQCPVTLFMCQPSVLPADAKYGVQALQRDTSRVPEMKDKYSAEMERKFKEKELFKKGDIVAVAPLLRSDQKFSKDRRFWTKKHGPYVVDRRLRNGAYVIKDQGGNERVARQWELFLTKSKL
jgi:hypothetical protein